MQKGIKILIGLLFLSIGGYAYYVLFYTYQPKVTNCITLGSLALIWGIANLINWNKEGVLRKLDVIWSNKIYSMFKRTPAPPEKGTAPDPSFEFTNEEKRQIIKKRQVRNGAWKAPEVELIPPEPYLLRPAVGSATKPTAKPIDIEHTPENLSLDLIQDLLKRG